MSVYKKFQSRNWNRTSMKSLEIIISLHNKHLLPLRLLVSDPVILHLNFKNESFDWLCASCYMDNGITGKWEEDADFCPCTRFISHVFLRNVHDVFVLRWDAFAACNLLCSELSTLFPCSSRIFISKFILGHSCLEVLE